MPLSSRSKWGTGACWASGGVRRSWGGGKDAVAVERGAVLLKWPYWHTDQPPPLRPHLGQRMCLESGELPGKQPVLHCRQHHTTS